MATGTLKYDEYPCGAAGVLPLHKGTGLASIAVTQGISTLPNRCIDVMAIQTSGTGVGEIYDTIPQLVDRMRDVDGIEDWSNILQDHLSFGNKKLADNIAIFNMGTAHECPNMDTEHCQVSDGKCYATKPEEFYPGTALYRQRQEYLWYSLDAETFAQAFLKVVDRKRKDVDYLRFNESGDFRNDGDIIRVNRIAEILKSEAGIEVYCYSASDYLNWDLATEFTVNGSNPNMTEADQRYIVGDAETGIPADAFVCPEDCSECRACMTPGGSDEIYVNYH